jgi:alkylation response protein AidB-like acyl-CoA dehydrogenase
MAGTPVDFLALAAELASEFSETSAELDRNGGLPTRNLDLARERGVPALTVPQDIGGWGANLAEFARYQEQLARGDGATALILAMHHMLIGGEAESDLWPVEAFDMVCRAAVMRGALINAAASEPGAGSPSLGGLPQTRAELDGEAWHITGTKAYTTGAPALSYIRVAARVDAPDEEPFSARFLVTMPADGVVIEDRSTAVALRAAANVDVNFTRTPATFLYREAERGCEGNVWFQVAIAATYLGIGQAAYEAALNYTKHRQPRGMEKPISELESVRLRLGRMRADLMVARRNLFATCDEWVQLPRPRKDELVSSFGLAKAAATNAAVGAAAGAMRLAGAGALEPALPFERFVRETQAGLAHPPVDDVAYLGLAKEDLDI